MNQQQISYDAKRLASLYEKRATTAVNKSNAQRSLDDRKLEITPPDGWPGSNPEKRAYSEKIALAGDKECQSLQTSIWRYTDEIEKLTAEIEGIEAIRRKEESGVYSALAEALMGIRCRTSAPAIGHPAVRDAARYAAAQAAQEEAYEALKQETETIANMGISQTESETVEEIQRHVNDGAGEQVVFQEGGAIPGLVHGNQQFMNLSSVPAVDEDDLPF